MLAELAELGMDLARALHRRAMAQIAEEPAEAPAVPHPEPAPDPALQFARVARAVRQTIALEARIAEGRLRQEEKETATEAAAAREWTERKIEERQIEIRRGVGDAIGAAGGGTNRRVNWLVKLEREIEEDTEDPDQLPVEEVIARICRDLKIKPTEIPELADADWTEDDEEDAEAEEPDGPEPSAPALTQDGVLPAASQAPAPQAQAPPVLAPAPLRRHRVSLVYGTR